jgi:hypothetical protein
MSILPKERNAEFGVFRGAHKSSDMGTREFRPPFVNKKPVESGLLPAFY